MCFSRLLRDPAFARMSVCKLVLLSPRTNWSLIYSSDISSLHDGQLKLQSLAWDFSLTTKFEIVSVSLCVMLLKLSLCTIG